MCGHYCIGQFHPFYAINTPLISLDKPRRALERVFLELCSGLLRVYRGCYPVSLVEPMIYTVWSLIAIAVRALRVLQGMVAIWLRAGKGTKKDTSPTAGCKSEHCATFDILVK